MTRTSSPVTRLPWLTAVVIAITVNACGSKTHHESTEVYYLISANTKIDYWQEAAAGLSAAAREMGVRAEMLGPETYDPQAEKSILLKTAHQSITPSGILVSAADPELMREAIDSVMGAGIPVITIDADSPKSKRLLFIGTNNYEAGQTGGDLLAGGLNGKGTVAVYTIPGQDNLDERFEGYKRAMARQPGIKVSQVIDIRGQATKAFDATKELIDKKAVPDAFACLEALSCAEVADVLDRAGIHGKTLIAMDTNDTTLDWIRKGMIRATIAQKPYTMAFYGLHVVDELHHSKPSSTQGSRSSLPVFIDTGSTVVDKSNVASFRAAAH